MVIEIIHDIKFIFKEIDIQYYFLYIRGKYRTIV